MTKKMKCDRCWTVKENVEPYDLRDVTGTPANLCVRCACQIGLLKPSSSITTELLRAVFQSRAGCVNPPSPPSPFTTCDGDGCGGEEGVRQYRVPRIGGGTEIHNYCVTCYGAAGFNLPLDTTGCPDSLESWLDSDPGRAYTSSGTSFDDLALPGYKDHTHGRP